MSIDKKQLIKKLSFMVSFDGGLYYTNKNSKYPVFIMNMRKDNLDYVEYVKETIEHITSAKITDRKDYNTDGYNRKEQVRLQSRQHPLFKTLHDRIYIANHKVLDLHMLKLLDAEALAIIFMADGSVSLDNRHTNLYCNILLHTKGYSEADNLMLSKYIYDKLNIRTTIQKQGKYRYLRIKTADNKLFYDTVKPYTKQSFFYKLERIALVLNQGDDIV